MTKEILYRILQHRRPVLHDVFKRDNFKMFLVFVCFVCCLLERNHISFDRLLRFCFICLGTSFLE